MGLGNQEFNTAGSLTKSGLDQSCSEVKCTVIKKLNVLSFILNNLANYKSSLVHGSWLLPKHPAA